MDFSAKYDDLYHRIVIDGNCVYQPKEYENLTIWNELVCQKRVDYDKCAEKAVKMKKKVYYDLRDKLDKELDAVFQEGPEHLVKQRFPDFGVEHSDPHPHPELKQKKMDSEKSGGSVHEELEELFEAMGVKVVHRDPKVVEEELEAKKAAGEVLDLNAGE